MDEPNISFLVPIIRMIGTKRIAKLLYGIIKFAIEKKKEIPLLDGESDIAGIIYEVDNEAYFAQAAFRQNESGLQEVTRYLEITKLSDLPEKFLNNL
jgi:hypothetical protein